MTRVAGAATATLDPAESGAPAGARRYDRASEAPRREGTERLWRAPATRGRVIDDDRTATSGRCHPSDRRRTRNMSGGDMNAKRRGASLLLGVLLAACAGTPSSPSPTGSSPQSPSQSPVVLLNSTVTPLAPTASATAPTTPPSAHLTPPSVATITPSPRPTAAATPAPCVSLGAYTVVAGDTLWDIAEASGTTVESLLAANPQIADRRMIPVGEEIAISPLVLGALGGMSSGAEDINNRGQVVGWANTATSYYGHAFRWQDGVMTDLGTLGGAGSWAMAINDRGQVVGYSLIASDGSQTLGTMHAFLWEDGVMTDLGSLGGKTITPLDINELGEVIGYGDTATGGQHAFLWKDGVMTDLGTLGGAESQAFGINERGQVVGQSSTGSRTHAFLWQDGVLNDIGTFGWFGAWATAINDQGQMALLLSEPSGAGHAAFSDRGSVTGLGDPEGATRMASDLNNAGQVVGWDQIGMEGGDRAFAWQDGSTTPLPAADAFITEAHAVNDCGQVVGESAATRGTLRAVLWTTPTRATAPGDR
jgi:probable HAF family extracellular repeat protein